MGQIDPKFRRWVTSVSPDPETATLVITSINWQAILQLLVQIFEFLVQVGCISAGRLSFRVKQAMKRHSVDAIVLQLETILNDLKAKKGTK